MATGEPTICHKYTRGKPAQSMTYNTPHPPLCTAILHRSDFRAVTKRNAFLSWYENPSCAKIVIRRGEHPFLSACPNTNVGSHDKRKMSNGNTTGQIAQRRLETTKSIQPPFVKAERFLYQQIVRGLNSCSREDWSLGMGGAYPGTLMYESSEF